MARKPRIEFPGAFYHVIARGNNRQKIFACEEDYKYFLFFLKRTKERFKFTVYSYALMPNHFHLLIETGEVPLSKIMQSLQLNYTQYFNRRYKKSGHLFQGRYKAILCQKESYLLELIRYIALNPIRAKLAKSLVAWPWSSYAEIVAQRKPEIISAGDVLGLFGIQRGATVSAFQRFVNDGLSEGHKQEYYRLKDQRILGENEFAEDIIKNTVTDFEYRRISIDETVDIVAKHMGVGREVILSTTNERRGAEGKALVSYICRTIGGFRSKNVSRYFKRSEPAISKMVKNMEADIIENETKRRLIANIEDEIKKRYRPCMVREIDR